MRYSKLSFIAAPFCAQNEAITITILRKVLDE